MKKIIGQFCAVMIAALSLTACQKSEMDPMKAAYQDKAGAAVQRYAKHVSQAIMSAASTSSGRGFQQPSGGFDPFFGGNLYGGRVAQNGIDGETMRCVEMMNQIPREARYFYLRLGTLSRCLDVVMNYRNPLMTYGYRNMDQMGQYGWGYDLNYARLGSFSGFQGQDYNGWNSYAGTGFYPGQVPNYQVPGYGF